MADETKNVKLSIEKRVDDQLSGTSTIHWQGAGFDQGGVSEWFAPRVLGFSGAPARKSARTEAWTFDVNCFAHTGQGETKARVWELVDAVIAAFEDYDLAVLDWAAASPPVTTLYWVRFGRATVTPVPGGGLADDELRDPQQLNVRFTAWLIT